MVRKNGVRNVAVKDTRAIEKIRMPVQSHRGELLNPPKDRDVILQRWSEVFSARARDAAVLNRRGEKLRTFSDIESEASQWTGRLAQLPARSVVAVQIGNS